MFKFFILTFLLTFFVCSSWKLPNKISSKAIIFKKDSKKLRDWLKGAVATTLGAAFLFNPQLPLISPHNEVAAIVASNDNARIEVSVFKGRYSDPNHPNCLRDISVEAGPLGNIVTIRGSDQEDGQVIWTLKAIEKTPGEILVDFTPKGGPKDLLGVYDSSTNAIKWPDGNAWKKL